MSHEYEQSITFAETDYGYDYSYDNENGFLYIAPIPEFFTKEFKGLYYEGVSYSWDEIDYRMGVEYSPSVPEPSFYGLVLGFLLLTLTLINRRK
tara:strand:+ start:151 stop:432 length:282 start_codon:yes stop_codon:yes gene_type:complete